MHNPNSCSTSTSLTARFAGLTASIALLCALPTMAAPPTTVYAGGDGGVFRSTDGGNTWTNVTSAFVPNALAIDPLNADVIYAGSSTKIGSSFVPAVFKTTNGGTTWTAETNGLTSVNAVITSIQVNPSNPNIVYISFGGAAFGAGVYKSTDGGVNWSAANNGLTTTGPILSVQDIALDPLNVNTLYATGQTGFQTAKTTNGGASWSTLTGYPDGFGFNIAIHPVQDSTVLISGPFTIAKSTDAGTTWKNTASGFYWYLAIDPNTPSTIYADGNVQSDCSGMPETCSMQTGTIYKSTDTGSTWNVVGSLPTVTSCCVQVGPLVIDPANSSTLYLGGDTGVSRSTDSGATWTLVMPNNDIGSLVMAPNALQNVTFNLFEDLAQAAIAVANDFKNDPTIACGILTGYANQIPGLVSAGLLSSSQGAALTAQVQAEEASIPCP